MAIINGCVNPPYVNGIHNPSLSDEVPLFLLQDEFTTATSSPNGTAAEPGPGVRTITADPDYAYSIVGDALTIVDTPASSIFATFYYPTAITRVAGRMLIAKSAWLINARNQNAYIGFNTSATGAVAYPAMNYNNVGGNSINIRAVLSGAYGSDPRIVIANVSAGIFTTVQILRTAGSFFFAKLNGVWTLLYLTTTITYTPLYVGHDVQYSNSYTGNLSTDFIRVPTALWLPTPLLSTSGAMTWPTTNGLGHAEGVAGGLGSGGSGLTMLDAGTWATAGGYVLNTPVTGVEKVSDPGFASAGDWTDSGASFVVALGVATGTITSDTLTNTAGTAAIANQWYKMYSDITRSAGTVSMTMGGAAGPTVNSASSPTHTVRATSTGKALLTGAGYTGTVDNFSAKPLPISSLITNCQLSTTDVLVEEQIHARTLGTQVGMALNCDRSFAALCATQANAGQAVIALKNVTGVGGVGLTTSDGITVGGVQYTIASVTGGSNVAYNDTTKTQTITLGANLGAQVNVNDKVGLDWASWNGVVGPYFDGAGNVKLDEVKAGVYTNRASVAATFVADAKLVVRKVGTSYYLFYNNLYLANTSSVDAAAMAGAYHGMFSTYSLNTITSMDVYPSGSGGEHNILNTWSS